MSAYANQRRHPRVVLTHNLTLRFRSGAFVAEAVPLLNLGVGGCCLRVPTIFLDNLRVETPMEEIQFEHTVLLLPPVNGEVVYLLGEEKAEEWGYFLVGVAFRDVPAEFTSGVEKYLDVHEPKGQSSPAN